MTRSSSSTSSSSRIHLLILYSLMMVQWALMCYILSRQESELFQTSLSMSAKRDALFQESTASRNVTSKMKAANAFVASHDTEWKGVAVSFMLRRPKWFYKRYNVMIDNVMANIPQDWAVQLFVNREWFENECLAYHRGLKRLVESKDPRLVLTDLPDDLKDIKSKRLLANKWIWDHVIAERVLLFHGDGTLCSNTVKTWADFDEYHYVGVPWKELDGQGGAGSEFSLRSRSAMLAALEFQPRPAGQEDRYFVSTLQKINKKAPIYKIATPEVTEWFAGTMNLLGEDGTVKKEPIEWGPMVVSGTQAHLSDEARNYVLGTCPELKAIFPVLHNPNCFGARPNPELCAKSLGFEAILKTSEA